MSASTWKIYNDLLLEEGNADIDYAAATLKIALVTSSSNAINQALVGATYGSITNELSTANGYTIGGEAVTFTWTGGGASATSTLGTSGSVTWNITGSGVTWRAAVLYDSVTGKLIAYFLGDSTPADVTVAAGTPLVIVAGNIFVKSHVP